MTERVARDLNLLRAQRTHLSAQLEAGVDTRQATLVEAAFALADVEASIAALEPVALASPEASYLVARGRRRRGGGRTHVPMPLLAGQQVNDTQPNKEGDMARKSNTAVLEETVEALRKAEKSAGTTKWALSGAGAKANPPSKEKKAHLTEKLAKEQAVVAELRAKRDELKGKVSA